MSEDNPLKIKDSSSSSSSSSPSSSSSSEETTLVENTSLLPEVPAKRPKESPSDTSYFSHATYRPTFETNPRIQQNKLGKFWKENISLKKMMTLEI
jgi:hypothetical protein